jgi:hypothetical protein
LSLWSFLTSLNLNANPIAEEKGGEFKKEILIMHVDNLPRLTKLNKEEVTKDDYVEAKTEKEERRKLKEEEELAR